MNHIKVNNIFNRLDMMMEITDKLSYLQLAELGWQVYSDIEGHLIHYTPPKFNENLKRKK